MATGDRNDPYKNFRFLVEIDGISQGAFREVSAADVLSGRVSPHIFSDKIVWLGTSASLAVAVN